MASDRESFADPSLSVVSWETEPQVLFTSIPLPKPPKWVPRKDATFEHQGMESIASSVRAAGYDAEIVDPVAESLSLETLKALIQAHGRRLFAVGVFIRYKDFEVARALLGWLRATYPEALLFAGGPILESEQIDRVLAAGAHCIVHGEGEETSVELIRGWHAGDRDLAKTAGLFLPAPGGGVRQTDHRPPIRDLDRLPFPRRDVLRRLLARGEQGLLAAFTTVRGCYYPCSFCYINSDYNRESFGKGARFRSVENILEEMRYLHSIGVRGLNFVDSTFFLPGQRGQQRAIRIAQGMIERDFHFEMNMLARATDIQDASIEWLRRAGLVRTFVGIESFVQRTLDFLAKGSTVQQNIWAIEILRRHEVKIGYGLIMADPHTTVAELRTTVEHLDRLGLMLRAVSHLLLTNVVLVYPNTPLERKLRKEELLAGNVYFQGGKFTYLHPEVELFFDVAAHLERVWAYTYEIDLRWARRRADLSRVEAVKADAECRFVPWATRVLYRALEMLETQGTGAAADIRELIRQENIVKEYSSGTLLRRNLEVLPAAQQ